MFFLNTSLASKQEIAFTIVSFAIIAVFIHRSLYIRGLFELPSSKKESRDCSLIQMLSCLGLYFANSFFLTPLIYQNMIGSSFIRSFLETQKSQGIFIQSVYFVLNLVLIGTYTFFQKNSFFSKIWKDVSLKNSYLYDISIGFLTWFVAFPVIVVVNTLCETINSFLFKTEEIDQVAVKFLKNNTSSLPTLFFALALIVIAAPFIEEFLFRGCLQNFLRKIMGVKLSIMLTSLFFSLLHFSFSQQASNFPLLVSLFIFSLYLGFVYEKTRSLSSSIILHMTFNTISAVRIILN